jgi:CheY-like chemotaxis protein
VSGETILLVEDEPVLRKILYEAFVDDGYAVETVGTADDAWLRIASGLNFSLLVTDVRMPGELDGLDLARKVSLTLPPVPVVIMSGYMGARDIEPRLGVFVAKPFTPIKLMRIITAMLSHR